MTPLSPTLPQGVHDLDPATCAAYSRVVAHLEMAFQSHAFLPLRTPAIEHMATLMGKYGQEGEQLLFKILDSGACLSRLDMSSPHPLSAITRRGLRYDLTVPLARYVAQHRHALTFPFRRYQIGSVWRADRPQRGRYREFVQCDVDIVGSDHLLAEAELLVLVRTLLEGLGLEGFVVQLNHRGLLTAFAHFLGQPGEEHLLCRLLDKKEKIGWEAVASELIAAGFRDQELACLAPLLTSTCSLPTLIERFETRLGTFPAAQKALQELRQVADYTQAMGPSATALSYTPTLARGMAYYTGLIFEVTLPGAGMGSLVGGGRYQELTALFGLPQVGGVGCSFGLARLCEALSQQGKLPTGVPGAELLLLALAPEQEAYTLGLLTRFRQAGHATEALLAGKRLGKRMAYAQKKGIPWVAILGEQEAEQGRLTLRHLPSSQQYEEDYAGALERLLASRR